MSKILSGFIGLFLVVGVVAGVGYALFTDTASIQGVTIGTATPGLQICHHKDNVADPAIGCGESIPFPDDNPFGPLVPGGGDYAEFHLKNLSDGMDGDPLNLAIVAQITTAGGNWNLLKDAIEMRFCEDDPVEQSHACVPGTQTPWYTLSEWNTQARKVTTLNQGDETKFLVHLRMGSQYDNTYSEKEISDMNIVFTGTQLP